MRISEIGDEHQRTVLLNACGIGRATWGIS